jgi:hypothetical protein
MGILDRSESRGGAQVIWLAVHSTEGDDNPLADDAAALRDATWWEGSSHAIADDEPGSLLTPAEGCVPYERAAWTLRGGNRYSDNLELVARASWPRLVWLAQPRLLESCAKWLADRHAAQPWIPLRRLSLAEIRAHQPGVIGHVDYTNATGDGTHWDPGPGFPWDVVLARANGIANGEEDNMLSAKEIVEEFLETPIEVKDSKGKVTTPRIKTVVAGIRQAEHTIQGDTDDLQNRVSRVEDKLDEVLTLLRTSAEPSA